MNTINASRVLSPDTSRGSEAARGLGGSPVSSALSASCEASLLDSLAYVPLPLGGVFHRVEEIDVVASGYSSNSLLDR